MRTPEELAEYGASLSSNFDSVIENLKGVKALVDKDLKSLDEFKQRAEEYNLKEYVTNGSLTLSF